MHVLTHTAVAHLDGLFKHHTPATLPACIDCFSSVFGQCLPFVFIKITFDLHLDPELVLSTVLPSVPWQNTGSKHGSSRENSALWSDYRLSEDGPWYLSSSHSKGADGTHQKLMALRQQGQRQEFFAQTFWTLAVGLNYNESALKDLFNVCLDDPLPQWEMEGLRILDFWGFVRYLHHRSQWATPDHSEPLRRDFPTSPGLWPPLRSEGWEGRGILTLLCLLPSPLRSGSSKSPLLSQLRSGSSKSPLLSQLRSGSSKSPLLSQLRSGSSKSPLLSQLRSGSSKSPLLSQLRSGSSKSPLLSPLCSGSSKSPLLSQLRSGSSKSPLLRASSVPGARRVHSWASSVPGARRVHSWASSVPGARRVHSWARSVPGARRVHSWARSVPGARRVRSWARSVPGAWRVRSWARSVPGARRVRSVPGARRVRPWARSVPGARRVRSWARSVPGAGRVRPWARSVPARRVRSWVRSVPELEESAPEPAPIRELEESAPEPAPFRELEESAPEPAPFRELEESAPEPAPFRELEESTPESAPFRELEESAPFRELAESAPEPAPFRELAESAPAAPPWPPALPAPPWPPALLQPPWHSYLPPSPGPLPLHGPGPPSFPTPSRTFGFLFWGNVWKPFLEGGVLSWVQAWRSSLSPPEVAISLSPGLILPEIHTPVHVLTHTAVAHLDGLFKHHTPATLPACIDCFSSVFGQCLPFVFIKITFDLHLDPELVLSTVLPSVPWHQV